jgi:cyanophycinase
MIHRSRRALFAQCLLGLMLVFPTSAEAKQLWLIGGADPICSSTEPELCVGSRRDEAERYFQDGQALRANRFRYSDDGRRQLAALRTWIGGLLRQKAVLAGLDELGPRLRGNAYGESEWHEVLAPIKLGTEEQQLVDDIFQVRPLRRDGGTQREQVFLEASEPAMQAIYRDFVAAAAANPQRKDKSGRPRVVVLTSASTDVFASVDYYLALFEAAGAEARWLPLEPALIRAGNCDELEALRFRWNGVTSRAAIHPEWAKYQRDFCLHPERLDELVESADAFFFNGGDQSLTMRSLQLEPGQFTPLAKRLLARVEGGIPLGGTSAGDAVQAGNAAGTIPMISGGTSEHALRFGALAVEANTQLCEMNNNCTMHGDPDQLTYLAHGGLGVFTLGVTDSHFHESRREGRLLRLLLDTGTRFGFGVDEATALKAEFSSPDVARLQVMGKAGVWIVDTAGAKVSADHGDWTASGFRASRLLAGDSALWRNGALEITLDCGSSGALTRSTPADDGAFAAAIGERWSRLPGSAPVAACMRADGNWRYDQAPMRLTRKP